VIIVPRIDEMDDKNSFFEIKNRGKGLVCQWIEWGLAVLKRVKKHEQ